MNKEELDNKLVSLEEIGTLESYNEAIKLIDEYLDGAALDEVEFYEYRKSLIKIELLKLELKELNAKNYKEQIHLRGKVISLYKQVIRKTKNNELKLKLRYEMLEELKLHKEALSSFKKKDSVKLTIPQKVGLNILEISKTIDIFMKEKDILTKAKNIVKDTVVSTASIAIVMSAVGLAMQSLTGVPFTLSNLVKACPVIAYIGLSSIIRNLSSKTPFEQYLYQQSDEYKAIVENFYETNKDTIKAISDIVQEKESTDNLETKISINEQLISKIDELIKKTNVRGIRDTFALQALGYLRENKEYYSTLIDDYLEDKNDDKEKYLSYKNKLSKINYEIFKRGNSIGDAIKDSSINVAKNTAVMLVAKSILSVVAPNTFSITNINSLLEPFVFFVINGIIDVPTYRNKLKFKETDYEGKVKLKNKKRIEEILEMNKNQPVIA